MLPYILVILGAIATIFADWCGKMWSIEHNKWLFVLAVFLYAFSGFTFTLSLTMGKLTVLNAFWSVFVFVCSTLLGMVVFHESVSFLQKCALGFGLLSILLFTFSEI